MEQKTQQQQQQKKQNFMYTNEKRNKPTKILDVFRSKT